MRNSTHFKCAHGIENESCSSCLSIACDLEVHLSIASDLEVDLICNAARCCSNELATLGARYSVDPATPIARQATLDGPKSSVRRGSRGQRRVTYQRTRLIKPRSASHGKAAAMRARIAGPSITHSSNKAWRTGDFGPPSNVANFACREMGVAGSTE